MGYSIRRARYRPRMRDFGMRVLTRFVRLEVRFKRLIAFLSCTLHLRVQQRLELVEQIPNFGRGAKVEHGIALGSILQVDEG